MTAKTMAELIGEHQWSDLEAGCACGWLGTWSDYCDHAANALAAAGFGLVVSGTTTEWGVRRDADSAVYSHEQAERIIARQRKLKLKSYLIKRQVGPWELVEP